MNLTELLSSDCFKNKLINSTELWNLDCIQVIELDRVMELGLLSKLLNLTKVVELGMLNQVENLNYP